MTLVCSGMLGIDSGCDLLSFWHGGQVASEANFGLWPLLMGLLEYFQICTQSFRKYAISNQFWPLGGAPALYHYFRFSECVRFSMITIPLCINMFILQLIILSWVGLVPSMRLEIRNGILDLVLWKTGNRPGSNYEKFLVGGCNDIISNQL